MPGTSYDNRLKNTKPSEGRKAARPNGMFTVIFNLFLFQSVTRTCFKESIISPVPKKPHPACLNDYDPVALSPVFYDDLKRLVRDFIT